MTTHAHTHKFGNLAHRSWISGAVLVLLGLALFAQGMLRVDLGWLVVPALALVFLAAGVVERNAGLLIAGCVLGGAGAAVWNVLYPFHMMAGVAAESVQGAIVMLTLAAGFALITPVTLVVTGRAHTWALAVAAMLALVGGALLAGEAGRRALEAAAKVWPLILVAIGAGLIVRRK
jgi:hypothetical protein